MGPPRSQKPGLGFSHWLSISNQKDMGSRIPSPRGAAAGTRVFMNGINFSELQEALISHCGSFLNFGSTGAWRKSLLHLEKQSFREAISLLEGITGWRLLECHKTRAVWLMKRGGGASALMSS